MIVPRDQWGRPLLPDPTTGETRAWTRATTLAGTIADRFALERWAQRHIVRGMALRRELLVEAAAAGEERDRLDRVVERALEASSASSAADIGTAIHRLAELADLGQGPNIPDEYRADLDAYQAARTAAGASVMPEWVERMVVTPDVDAAGTPDRLDLVGGRLTISDLKTGHNAMRYSRVEIAAQLAIYSRATHWVDADGETLHTMPEVDQHVGLVYHLPAGSGRCDVWELDLDAGWEIAQMCYQVHQMRKRKELARPFVAEPDVPTEPDVSAVEWARARVEAIKAWPDSRASARLAGLWSTMPEIPTFPQGGPRGDAEVDKVAAWCELVEMEFEMPFGASDPRDQQQQTQGE